MATGTLTEERVVEDIDPAKRPYATQVVPVYHDVDDAGCGAQNIVILLEDKKSILVPHACDGTVVIDDASADQVFPLENLLHGSWMPEGTSRLLHLDLVVYNPITGGISSIQVESATVANDAKSAKHIYITEVANVAISKNNPNFIIIPNTGALDRPRLIYELSTRTAYFVHVDNNAPTHSVNMQTPTEIIPINCAYAEKTPDEI